MVVVVMKTMTMTVTQKRKGRHGDCPGRVNVDVEACLSRLQCRSVQPF